MTASEAAAREVRHAASHFLDEGEVAVSWVMVIEVVGQNGVRYLAHRAGGGADGCDPPTTWAAVGMLRSAQVIVEDGLYGATRDDEDEGD